VLFLACAILDVPIAEGFFSKFLYIFLLGVAQLSNNHIFAFSPFNRSEILLFFVNQSGARLREIVRFTALARVACLWFCMLIWFLFALFKIHCLAYNFVTYRFVCF